MDLHFQGMTWLTEGQTPDNVARARGFFDRALAADPDNVEALVLSAGTDVSRAYIPSCPIVWRPSVRPRRS